MVAFGGGSGLDAGKVIAFMSGQTRPLWDFEDIGDWWTRADPKGIFPIVAVPTPVDDAHQPDFRPLLGASDNMRDHGVGGEPGSGVTTADEQVCLVDLDLRLQILLCDTIGDGLDQRRRPQGQRRVRSPIVFGGGAIVGGQ